MEILSKLFGSEARVKIIRLFLFNPEEIFDIDDISERSKVNKNLAKKEVDGLLKAALLKKKSFYKLTEKKSGKKVIEKRKRVNGYSLNPNFPYLSSLRNFLMSGRDFGGTEVLKKLSKAGQLKLVIVAGVFTKDETSRLDLLVVGNNLNKTALSNVVSSIEADLGKEINYAYFETGDFKYRIEMCDKLIKDVLDYPHQKLLDRIPLQF